jgi:hypothetical protein
MSSIFQPDGVVEFLDVDPRPRYIKAGRSHTNSKADHTSGPKTNWTDNIADRFKKLMKNLILFKRANEDEIPT